MTFLPLRTGVGTAALVSTLVAALVLTNYFAAAAAAEADRDRQREEALQDLTLYNAELQTFAAALALRPSGGYRDFQLSNLVIGISHGDIARDAWLDGRYANMTHQLQTGRAVMQGDSLPAEDPNAARGDHVADPIFPYVAFMLPSLAAVLLWGVLMGLSPTKRVLVRPDDKHDWKPPLRRPPNQAPIDEPPRRPPGE